MKEIKETIQQPEVTNACEVFADVLEEMTVSSQCPEEKDQCIVAYGAGYGSHTIGKGLKCQSCIDILVSRPEPPEIVFTLESGEEVPEEPDFEARNEYIRQVTRGGLSTPSDLCYMSCLYAWNAYREITGDEELKERLFAMSNPRSGFVSLLLEMTENSSSVLEIECDEGHSFHKSFKALATKMFNIFTKNVVSEANDAIREKKLAKSKKRSYVSKQSPSGRKSAKLQSESK